MLKALRQETLQSAGWRRPHASLEQAMGVPSKTKNIPGYIQVENSTKSRCTQNTSRNPQQPGDGDHLETTCDETRPTRSPIHARFHRSLVGGNRPHTALAHRSQVCGNRPTKLSQSVKITNATQTDGQKSDKTHRQTDRQRG